MNGTREINSILRNKSLDFGQSSKGFSIVELLIAGTLGLILLGGAIQLFSGSNRSYSMQGEMASIQEDGRFALMYLERQFENAGWINDLTKADFNLPILVDKSSDGDNDSITVAYYAETNGVDNRDCNGAIVDNGEIENTFSVSENNLVCEGNGGGGPQPLISGVERFQVLYGVETDGACPDGVVNNYLSLSDVDDSNLSEKIVSVRVGFILQSDENILPTAESKNFSVLNVDYKTPSDTRLRRLFQQTIFMPNAAYRAIGDPQQLLNCLADNVGNS